MPKDKSLESSALVKELEDIKRLLILGLLRTGASQEDIAAALNMSQPSVSRMFSKGLKKISRSAGSK